MNERKCFLRKKIRNAFQEILRIQEHVQSHISIIEYGIIGKYWVVNGDLRAGYGHSGRLNSKIAETIDEDTV